MRRRNRNTLSRGWWLLAAALILAPLRGPGAAHCAQTHGDAAIAAASHGAEHHHGGAIPLPKDSGAPDECPHCPVTQCASQPSCSVQMSDATDSRRSVSVPSAHCGAPVLLEATAGSAAFAPPTPPPQLDA